MREWPWLSLPRHTAVGAVIASMSSNEDLVLVEKLKDMLFVTLRYP